MIIVFEGADKVGKTTRFDKFVSLYNKQHTHIKHLEISNEDFKGTVDKVGHVEYNIIKQMYDPNKIYIMDRFIPSNIVYPKVFSRDCDLSYINEEDFNIKYIYITADYDDVMSRSRTEDKYEYADYIDRLLKQYEQYFSNVKSDVLRIDTTTEGLNESILRMLKFVER